jgi:hypothetical protein
MIAAGLNGASGCDQLVRIGARELPEESGFGNLPGLVTKNALALSNVWLVGYSSVTTQ